MIMRHNELRNTEAELLREVCKDVATEPTLLTLTAPEKASMPNSAIVSDDARLDVSARGFWNPMQKAYFDVRVFHPNSDSYKNKPVSTLYRNHENQKKAAYNKRVIDIEHGTFSPLIFSTTGGMGLECSKYHKQLAVLLSGKRGENYTDTIRFVRLRLRFSLLRSTLIAIRGTRQSAHRFPKPKPINELDIGLIDDYCSNLI